MAPVRINIELPAVLTVALGMDRIEVKASTLAAALSAAYRSCPALQPALCDETGAFRPHVLCLLETGGEMLDTRWMKDLKRPLQAGDRIVVMQAVSGG